jgi:hypothetical protein
VELNAEETAQPNRENVEIYRELQELQDELSESLRDVFVRHREFLGRK